jgi:hypothetical protein
MPVILAIRDAEIKMIEVRDQPRQNNSKDPLLTESAPDPCWEDNAGTLHS